MTLMVLYNFYMFIKNNYLNLNTITNKHCAKIELLRYNKQQKKKKIFQFTILTWSSRKMVIFCLG